MKTNQNAELLSFLEHLSHHPSGNFHGFYAAEVATARQLLAEMGGELREIGRYRAGSWEPMGYAEYNKRKDERKMERALVAMQEGHVWVHADDVYSMAGKRVCTLGEMRWIRRMLKHRGYRTKKARLEKGKGKTAFWLI